MQTLRGRWIDVRCRCGHCTPQPVRLMVREDPACVDRTLADVVVSLRCNGCRGRQLALHLCENGYGVGSLPKSITLGVSTALHDGGGPEPPEQKWTVLAG